MAAFTPQKGVGTAEVENPYKGREFKSMPCSAATAKCVIKRNFH